MNAPSTDAVRLVDDLLARAMVRAASDLHLTASRGGYDVTMRVDGLVEPMLCIAGPAGVACVNRLMVLAGLLTYRIDVPQEGKARVRVADESIEIRVSVIPATHGLRCAVRLPDRGVVGTDLSSLSLPTQVEDALEAYARRSDGMLLIVGPAGSGKTTTLCATLAHIVRDSPGVSIVSIEDPVERDLPGVVQIEVTPFGELTYERALRSVMRQDPQVLAIGEVRDAATATIAVQAALSGHRLLATMHATSAGAAVSRLMEMGIEPYQLAGALVGVVNQRLVRRRVDRDYSGRLPLAEFVSIRGPVRELLLARADANRVDAAARRDCIPLAQSAQDAVRSGLTDDAELIRVGIAQ
jgi:type II secretory ATPase GspE/PulE/Tfp pilus assembly ATPase PilB-like protein